MSTVNISSKLPQVGTTIFAKMTALAHKHNAINLAQGFPDFPTDPRLVALATEAMTAGHNQYAPMPGLPALRQLIAGSAADRYGATYDWEKEVTITNGATEALFCAITALIQEGDEVIVLEPAYDSYIPAVKLAGGSVVGLELEPPNYRIDWNRLKRLINGRTRAIILNTPHNPTGTILRQTDMQELANIVRGNGIFLISDEVYEHMVFDGARHESIARYPELRERAFVISSFGKSLHTTGWKVGACMAPASLTEEFRKIHQYVNFSISHPFQVAIERYLRLHPEEIDQLPEFYGQKRDLFQKLLADSRFRLLPSEGTYFQLVDYSAISDLPDTEFANWLTGTHGVAAIPVSVFYRQKTDRRVVRFCFAKQDATLEEAANRLQKI